jgi:hypothetical protein
MLQSKFTRADLGAAFIDILPAQPAALSTARERLPAPRIKLRLLRHSAMIAAFVALPLMHAAAFSTLPDIVTSSTVPANGDVNPYGVAVVPAGFPAGAAIKAGDVLVSNFNNGKNLQGTGSTIIKLTPTGVIAPNGTASVFFNGGTGHGLTTALGVLQRGYVLVGNVPTTDGTSKTVKPGSLLVLDRNGKQIASIAASTLDGPWDLTIIDGGDTAQVFVSNVLNGTVSRLDLTVGATTVTVKGATRIASGYTHVPNAAALLLGPTGVAYDQFQDRLYVASTGDNAIYAIDHAGSATKSVTRGTLISKDTHLRGPLALALAANGNLLTANGDAVNADPTHPSEIVELTETGQFVSEFNVDSGQGGAFGLAIAGSPSGAFNLVVVDDVTNSLAVLPLNP